MYKNFDELIKSVQRKASKKKVVLAAAHDEHALEAVIEADKNNIAEPVLVGDSEKIVALLEKHKVAKDKYTIIHTDTDSEASKKAVELIRNHQADFLMKGKMQTSDLLREVVNKETGLYDGKPMSHLAIQELSSYHKLLGVTDGGMIMYPSLEEKKSIIENAVQFYHNMGYKTPKVGVLAAVEVINPKMPEAVEAGQLKEMNQRGEIKNCLVEGPISYDLAMNKESALIKGYESPVAGDPDILVVPNITAGNILGKSLIYSAGAKMAGIIIGAKVPIVLTSRGASTEEKYLSLVIAASAV